MAWTGGSKKCAARAPVVRSALFSGALSFALFEILQSTKICLFLPAHRCESFFSVCLQDPSARAPNENRFYSFCRMSRRSSRIKPTSSLESCLLTPPWACFPRGLGRVRLSIDDLLLRALASCVRCCGGARAGPRGVRRLLPRSFRAASAVHPVRKGTSPVGTGRALPRPGPPYQRASAEPAQTNLTPSPSSPTPLKT